MLTDFNNIDHFKENGFVGFKTKAELFKDSSIIPKEKGVYLILHTENEPIYLKIGTGGHFKNKNPNVSLNELKTNWVGDVKVVYIGKATSLRARLRQYFAFGQGKKIGHWGGRFIWQLKNSRNLIVCWKILTNEDPGTIESKLIKSFKDQFGKRPFANLKD